METAGTGARLIIVCGLPGSGKTTLASTLESKLRAVRFSPDEWMDALALNLWEEEKRAKIEALQWKLAQQLLAQGHTVIIEWGTWARTERDTLRLEARAVGAAVELHYVSAPAERAAGTAETAATAEARRHGGGKTGRGACEGTPARKDAGAEGQG